ncbi:hypothetical protein MKO06_04350 [Gramella sp. GC03-9]|uniref:Replication-associated protein G2P N-terminal domain-containing protein n=1 Tax=Christiangramia oceanisediminis TaxID=2920386 RepID=A0A9X2I4C1_9FLAO|nr:hypothetical protein [Gramella oceanisediminis]MCP9199127.1 hypothetical protein [Gramella oceanisediminis]
MVDNMKLEIHWPARERNFFDYNEPLIHIGKDKRKFLITNPCNGENLELVADNRTPYCYIKGSWRRWYFGLKGSLSQDLNRRQFFEVAKEISKITGISIRAIMAGNIKKVELGFNVRLKREHDLFIPSLKRYGKLKRMIVEKETVKFLGTKLTFKCYDKGKQLLPKIAKRKIADKLNKCLLFMRLELELRSISATKFSYLKRPFDIYKNWDLLLDELCSIILTDIEKVDLFSSDLDFTQFPKTLTEFEKILMYKGIKNTGLDEVILWVNSRSLHKPKRSYNRKKIYEIFHSHKSSDKQYVITEINSRILSKAGFLK